MFNTTSGALAVTALLGALVLYSEPVAANAYRSSAHLCQEKDRSGTTSGWNVTTDIYGGLRIQTPGYSQQPTPGSITFACPITLFSIGEEGYDTIAAGIGLVRTGLTSSANQQSVRVVIRDAANGSVRASPSTSCLQQFPNPCMAPVDFLVALTTLDEDDLATVEYTFTAQQGAPPANVLLSGYVANQLSSGN
jgi:hypothetical protein